MRAEGSADDEEPAFQAAVQRAKLDAMRELAYGASHEINNPLANIASRAQMLLRHETDAQRRRALSTIHSQAMRAHEMIADMMYFAKPPAPRREWIFLADLLQRWRQLMDAEMPVGVQWDVDFSDSPVRLHVDPAQLLVALQALGRNAVEAMDGEGTLRCRVRGGDSRGPDDLPLVDGASGWSWVFISDTGPGIPPSVLAHLFDPFFSGREAGRGLGLGLSKAWRIVTDHGGILRAEATAQGACLAMGFPISEATGEVEEILRPLPPDAISS